MDRDQLKSTLQQLHEQLQSGEPVDPEIQSLLQQLTVEMNNKFVRDALTTGLQTTTSGVEAKDTLLDRLLGLTDEFEETHPQLAEAIGRVATALSRIGI